MLVKSNYLVPKGYVGITLFPFIFVRKDKVSKVLVNHERIHIRQQAELLLVGFYVVYLVHWLWNLAKYKDANKAYRNIVFEREAYENEGDLDYLKNRKIFALWR